ncbi:MAG: ABC transporter ATP-binding protein, partial [Spirochaetales bacterium]|nr:ABC transporter ATP-binding protein [Candidatus Physcosoma equi]
MAKNVIALQKPKDAKKTMFRLLSFLKDFRLVIAFALALSFLSNVLSLLGPSYAGFAINAAAAGKGMVDFSIVLHYVYLMLLVQVASSLITLGINIVMAYVAKKTAKNLRQVVFEKLSRLPVSFFDRNQAGDIISRVSYDVDVVSTSLQTDIVHIMTSIVTVIGSFIMMVKIAPPLSAIVLVTIPIAITFTVFIKRKTRPLFIHRSKTYGKMNGFVEEMCSGRKTIQAYAYEDQVCSNYASVNGEASDAYGKADHVGVSIGPTMG